MPPIYLDNNATTRPADEVVEAMTACLRERWGNPSSVHRFGQQARQAIELARYEVARLIGAETHEIVFTSGATESINLAINGTLRDGEALVTVRTEHPAVREIAERREASGQPVHWLPVNRFGLVDIDALGRLLVTPEKSAPPIGLVSIMWVNNETGAVQPIEVIGRLCSTSRVPLHSDATQAVGRMRIDVRQAPVDLLSFSAHKFHGPKGVGALRLGSARRPVAQIVGGPQERNRRGGTENTAGIVGMGVAAALARDWMGGGAAGIAALRDRFEKAVLDRVEGAVVNGGLPPHVHRSDAPPRLWSTSNIGFPPLEAEALLMLLSERGVCASAGSACSSGSLEPSPVLRAMGIPEPVAHGSVRFSLSRETTEAEVDEAVEILVACVERLRRSAGSVGSPAR